MNILITGANGFLGSNAVKSFYRDGHNILCFSKTDSNLPINCKSISCYADEYLKYTKSIKQFEPDIVIHFGWSGGNNRNDSNDISKQYCDNVPHSINFLQFLSTLSKKPKFVGVGTFEEYGQRYSLVDESTSENPNTLYGLAKLQLKQLVELYCSLNNMEWLWLRPCFVYGVGDVRTRLIPTVIKKCIQNQDIYLDTCSKIIDYIYVDDFTELFKKIILSDQSGVFNICSGSQYHLRYIIQTIHNLTKSKSKIIFKDLDKISHDKDLFICGLNKKALDLTNYKLTYSLESGLQKIIKHERKK